MRIHISETTYKCLAKDAGFRLAYRDKVTLKVRELSHCAQFIVS